MVLVATTLCLAGLILLIVDAKYFIDGIALIAEVLGVPPLIIGMTLVAFGTSTPELVVNAVSAQRGETSLAFGNIVGSCTVNIGLVLAVTALVKPIRVESTIITREIPMLIVSVGALLVLGLDSSLNGMGPDALQRIDGLVLLLLFSIFIYYTIIYSVASQLLRGRLTDALVAEVYTEQPPAAYRPRLTLFRSLTTLLGLIGVSIGADWTVNGASSLARLFGIPENIIGLTIVSLGTTLPELITCVIATRRGNGDIALGNVVGSNLFNILAIGGLVSTIAPVAIPPGGHLDIAFVGVLTAVLLPIAIRSGQTITRGEGAVLLTAYLGFLAFRLAGVR
jgi:cation:H+ antiporter